MEKPSYEEQLAKVMLFAVSIYHSTSDKQRADEPFIHGYCMGLEHVVKAIQCMNDPSMESGAALDQFLAGMAEDLQPYFGASTRKLPVQDPDCCDNGCCD